MYNMEAVHKVNEYRFADAHSEKEKERQTRREAERLTESKRETQREYILLEKCKLVIIVISCVFCFICAMYFAYLCN